MRPYYLSVAEIMYIILQLLYVCLFQRDSYFSGISAASSALIHEYTNMCVINKL